LPARAEKGPRSTYTSKKSLALIVSLGAVGWAHVGLPSFPRHSIFIWAVFGENWIGGINELTFS
jgi:hypothetical protein